MFWRFENFDSDFWGVLGGWGVGFGVEVVIEVRVRSVRRVRWKSDVVRLNFMCGGF